MNSQFFKDWRVWAAVVALLVVFGLANRSDREAPRATQQTGPETQQVMVADLGVPGADAARVG